MMDLKLDKKTHDLVVSSTGDLVMVRGADWFCQSVRIRLLTIKGEVFLGDDEDGAIDLDNWLGRADVSLARVRADIRREILATPGAKQDGTVEVTFDFDPTTRELKTTWEADTTYGRLSDVVRLDQVIS